MKIALFIKDPSSHNHQGDSGTQAISVTANASGFTTMNSVLSKNDIEKNKNLASFVNQSKEILFLKQDGLPSVILVPKDYSVGSASAFIKKIIELCLGNKIETLYFTHFQFMRARFPVELISEIIREFKNFDKADYNLNVFFEIDASYKNEMKNLLDTIT